MSLKRILSKNCINSFRLGRRERACALYRFSEIKWAPKIVRVEKIKFSQNAHNFQSIHFEKSTYI